MRKNHWEGYMEPFRLYGNCFFVGSYPASAHLIDTGEGLILLDAGYQEGCYAVVDAIWRLGFRPADVKYIVLSHGHIDHAAATGALAELTGAEVFIGAGDLRMVDGSHPELTWAPEYDMAFPPAFRPDHLLRDGDRIRLGNTEIECVATPGHTPGTFSFFWTVRAPEGDVRAGTMGGAGLNSMESAYIRKYGLESEDWRGHFAASLERCRREKVELFIGNHCWQNHTPERYARLKSGDAGAFVDPGAWGAFLDASEAGFRKLLERDPL